MLDERKFLFCFSFFHLGHARGEEPLTQTRDVFTTAYGCILQLDKLPHGVAEKALLLHPVSRVAALVTGLRCAETLPRVCSRSTQTVCTCTINHQPSIDSFCRGGFDGTAGLLGCSVVGHLWPTQRWLKDEEKLMPCQASVTVLAPAWGITGLVSPLTMWVFFINNTLLF